MIQILLSRLSRAELFRGLWRAWRLRSLRKQLHAKGPLKIVLGAGGTRFPGWIGTDVYVLDVKNPYHWQTLFEGREISHLLAEHVFEHLSESECRIAFELCHRYLQRGGLLRVAVPDGYRRDSTYVQAVAPPIQGHKVLFNVNSLVRLVESVGFTATPLEYFNAQGEFKTVPWDVEDGFVSRSLAFDRQVAFRVGALHYTSLIVDARKPDTGENKPLASPSG